ncbi:unnamed protein product [Brachionus calyciflorus]|uniref:Uncharacterized protein n=1 Tax=Brachionus calyciflorus TaxID=104777 RepID=A0A813WM45_9BILA|nr:unnamed protein product [Brachionus calyciflorus]
MFWYYLLLIGCLIVSIRTQLSDPISTSTKLLLGSTLIAKNDPIDKLTNFSLNSNQTISTATNSTEQTSTCIAFVVKFFVCCTFVFFLVSWLLFTENGKNFKQKTAERLTSKFNNSKKKDENEMEVDPKEIELMNLNSKKDTEPVIISMADASDPNVENTEKNEKN